MATTQLTHTQEIIERHDKFMSINYARFPVAFVRGEGSELFDAEGKRHLDLFAGFGGAILGHCHPDLVRAVTEQANQFWHAGNQFHTEPQTRLAEAISKHGFGGKSFFAHSGADANEAAFKLARLYGKKNKGRAKEFRYKVISTERSFHGRTLGTMVATGQLKARKGYDPYLAGYSQVPYNDLNALRAAIDPETVAIIVEPIQGEGGNIVAGDDYLPGLRKLCDEHDVLLICDEVWTGCGRTGKYFAHQHWNIAPDIMTLAKGVGGGLAVGVMCAKPAVAELFDYRVNGGVVAHASTLGGNCLAMAAASTVFAVIERDGLLAHATTLGKRATDRLNRFAQKHPVVKQVRGKGLFIGVELDLQKSNGRFAKSGDVVKKCLERGLIVGDAQDTILRLAPALTISESHLDEGLGLIEEILS